MNNNKPMTAQERENVTQAFIDMYRGNTEKHTSVNSKATHTKKKLYSNDIAKLQEVTMRLLQGN